MTCLADEMDALPRFPEVLTVGAVDLRVRSALVLYDLPASCYGPFLAPRPPGTSCSSAIDVEVLGALAPPNGSPRLFDSGSSWDMQSEESGYRLNFHCGNAAPVHTVALCDVTTTRVQVYVVQDMPATEQRPRRALNPVRYPLDQLLLMNHLAYRGGVIAHAAGAVVDGGALGFLGASGAGKSTLTRMFKDADLGSALLSDDRLVLQTASDGEGGAARAEAWGTPWQSEARVANNAHAPLAALLFLVQADVNELAPLSVGAAVRRLMPVVSCPWYDQDRCDLVLENCARIVTGVPCYELRFRLDGGAVPLIVDRSWGREGG